MTLRWCLATLVLGFASTSTSQAAPAAAAVAAPPAEKPVDVDTAQLAANLRSLLLAALPDPILTVDHGWGRQKEVLLGMKMHRTGRLRVRAEAVKGVRNDGLWQRVRVTAVDPEKSLALGVREVRQRADGAVTFEAYLTLDVRTFIDQEVWKSGARLYGGETRLRSKAALKLVCEVTNRVEAKPGAVLPDVVMRVRVTSADLYYTDLVCEHTLGLNGKPAAKIGEVAHKLMTEFKPSLERDLLAKANAAIVRAADTKEVRIELDRLLMVK